MRAVGATAVQRPASSQSLRVTISSDFSSSGLNTNACRAGYSDEIVCVAVENSRQIGYHDA
jgi:hypothetical protein